MTYMDKLLVVCEAVDNRIVADCYMESGLNMAAVKKKVSTAIQKILEALKQFMQKAKASFGAAKARAILKSKFFRQNVTIRWQISDKEIRTAMKQINMSALKATTTVRKIHDQVMGGKMDPEVGYAKLNDILDTWSRQTTDQVNRSLIKLDDSDAGAANVSGATQSARVVNILKDITDLADAYADDCYKVVQKHVMQLRKEAADLEKAKEMEERAAAEYAKLSRVGKLKYKSKQSLLNFKNKCASTLSSVCRNAVAKIQRAAQIKKLINALKTKVSSALHRKKAVTESADTIDWMDNDTDLFLEFSDDEGFDFYSEDADDGIEWELFEEATNKDVKATLNKAKAIYKKEMSEYKTNMKAGKPEEALKNAKAARSQVLNMRKEVEHMDINAWRSCVGFFSGYLKGLVQMVPYALIDLAVDKTLETIANRNTKPGENRRSYNTKTAVTWKKWNNLLTGIDRLAKTYSGDNAGEWLKNNINYYRNLALKSFMQLERDCQRCQKRAEKEIADLKRATSKVESVEEDELGDAIDTLYEETCHMSAPSYDYKYEDLFEESVDDVPEEDFSYEKDELAELIAAI